MTKTFPKLYKKSSTGKISEWELIVEESNKGSGVIKITHGYSDGKKQEDLKVIEEGKNAGKENETTALEQAIAQAESKYKKQLDKGYVDSMDDVDKVLYLPMLAHSYDKRGKDIKFPCIAQRKFDGVRCLATVENGKVVLKSRKGKVFPHMEHLHDQVKTLIESTTGELILDGELYSETLTFQRTVGLVKRVTLKEGDEGDSRQIMFRLYDCIFPDNPTAAFMTRYNFLDNLLKRRTNFAHLKLTENFTVRDEKAMKELHDVFVQEGHEGIILRNIKGIYGVNKRSKDLQKYKHFLDDEFEVVSFTEGVGRAKGTVIWTCKTKEDKEFNVRPRGTEQERRNWFENGEKYIGKMITVRYFEMTDDNIPRFPVGLVFRDYE